MPQRIKSYWDVLLPKFESINIYEGPEPYFNSCVNAGPLIVLLYATHMCASEVHNGGFLQLFWNNTGIAVPEAIEGYRTIGMTRLADLVESTAKLLGYPYPRDREDRWDALLNASGKSSDELETIFRRNANTAPQMPPTSLYKAFAEATAPLNFDPLDRQFWDLAASDAGGFQEAATRYTRTIEL